MKKQRKATSTLPTDADTSTVTVAEGMILNVPPSSFSGMQETTKCHPPLSQHRQLAHPLPEHPGWRPLRVPPPHRCSPRRQQVHQTCHRHQPVEELAAPRRPACEAQLGDGTPRDGGHRLPPAERTPAGEGPEP